MARLMIKNFPLYFFCAPHRTSIPEVFLWLDINPPTEDDELGKGKFGTIYANFFEELHEPGQFPFRCGWGYLGAGYPWLYIEPLLRKFGIHDEDIIEESSYVLFSKPGVYKVDESGVYKVK